MGKVLAQASATVGKLNDGRTSYIHVAYANSADGNASFSTTDPTDRAYVGTLTDFFEQDSTNPADYTWSLVRGATGVPGPKGADGKTTYVHIAYADSSDGKSNFSVTDSTGRSYIGVLTDEVEQDSTDYTKYTWSLIKGDDGEDGVSPINLVVYSSNGYQFKNNIINTTFTAILYQNNKEIDSDGTKFAYVWSKTNADGTADTAWNLAHQASQKSITITNSDVMQRATFDCTAESLN